MAANQGGPTYKLENIMNKLFSIIAALLLSAVTLLPTAQAQTQGDITGTWTFFVTINGAPPCQCIQIARLRADGTLEGPANDHLSGAAVGIRRGANLLFGVA